MRISRLYQTMDEGINNNATDDAVDATLPQTPRDAMTDGEQVEELMQEVEEGQKQHEEEEDMQDEQKEDTQDEQKEDMQKEGQKEDMQDEKEEEGQEEELNKGQKKEEEQDKEQEKEETAKAGEEPQTSEEAGEGKREFKRHGKQHAFCTNCGWTGHSLRFCREPIMSYGVVTVWIDDPALTQFCRNQFLFRKERINVGEYIRKNAENKRLPIAQYVEQVKAKVRFLVVQRRHTINFLQLVRGRYDDTNVEELHRILGRITREEVEIAKTVPLDELWKSMLCAPLNTRDADRIRARWNNLRLLLDSYPGELQSFVEPEWGFPKGRRNNNEDNMTCALREFSEETGLERPTLLKGIYPLSESLVGSNGYNYKHVYYMSMATAMEAPKIDPSMPEQYMEVRDVRWVSYPELVSLIRPYNYERLEIIENVIYFYAYNLRYFDRFWRTNREQVAASH